MSNTSIPRQYKQIIDPFLASGAVTLERGSKHVRIVRADGHKCPVPGSSSDHRSLLNFKSQFRKFVAGESIFR